MTFRQDQVGLLGVKGFRVLKCGDYSWCFPQESKRKVSSYYGFLLRGIGIPRSKNP